MWSRYPGGSLGRVLATKQEKQKPSRAMLVTQLTHMWRKFSGELSY